MENVELDLNLMDLNKENFRRTFASLQKDAHSLLLLTFQWKEIESYFDSTKNSLKARAEELEALEESIKGRALDLETKEKELCSIQDSITQKSNDLEKKEKEIEKRKEEVEELEKCTKRIADENAKVKERLVLQEEKISDQEKLRVQFEPLISLLAKNIDSSSDTTMPSTCSAYGLNENANDLAEKNTALAGVIGYLDPGKLVLDALKGSVKRLLSKENEDSDEIVVNSWIVLLEKMIPMNLKIRLKVKQEAMQLGIDLVRKAQANLDNYSWVLGCLLFLAVYGLASVTSREVIFSLLNRVLLYDQAPKLFGILGLEDEVSGVIKTLKEKEEYWAAIKFMCELRLFKLHHGGPGRLLTDYLNASEKSARAMAGNGNSMEVQKAIREKRKADAMTALEYIRGKSFESRFPVKTLKKLIFELTKDELADKAIEPLHKSDEKGIQPEAKRQRLTQPRTPFQNSTASLLRSKYVSSEEKIEESGVNHQAENKATEEYPLEETDIDLLNALKSTSDPAKLFLDKSMALCPINPEGSYELKLLITPASCSTLLDQLKNLSPQIGHMVQTDAKKLAVYWKDKVSKSKSDDLEVVCFLNFLGIFGIVSEFQANDLLSLLNNDYWRTTSPDLCQFLGLTNAIPGFIQNLIRTGHRIRAIEYIYSLDVVHSFQPISSIINDFLRITKEYAEKMFRNAKNEPLSQVAAIDRQIKSLRSAIRCISNHKLESDFQLSNLEDQITSLLKERSKLKTPCNVSGSKPQTKPNLVEAVPVNNNPPLETSRASVSDSVSKPESKKEKERGQKRRFSGNKHRSVSLQHRPHTYVASYPRNHHPVRSYSLSQRLTWPEDHSYHNQRTQSEVGQGYYHYHQPLDPFYRNNF